MRYAVCSAGPRRVSDIASSPMARARAAFKVGDDEVSIANAARRFLAEQDRMEELVGRIFAGHLRSIVGALTVEEIIKERDRVAQEVKDGSHAAAARGRKRHAKTDKTDCRHLRQLLAEGRLPGCWVPPPHILECRALLETYHDLRAEHTAWLQRIHAVFFHQGAPRLGEGFLRTEQGVAAVRAASAAHLSPAGQFQIDTALEVIAALGTRLQDVRRQLREAAANLAGARALAARIYGVGPIAALAMTCWLAGAGRFSSSRKAVRFTGLDITVYSSDGKRAPGR